MKDNSDIWRTTDKAWMNERKKEWKDVVTNLNKLSNLVDKKGQKYHKELFFSGNLHEDLMSKDPEIYGRMLDLRVFDNNELFFRMWYHPEPSLDAFRELVESEIYEHRIEACKSLLFVRIVQGDFASAYGLAGGVERLMVQSVAPDFDFKAERSFATGQKISMGVSPGRLLRTCPSAIFYLLCGIKTNPFNPGQYLISHLDFTLETYPELIKSEKLFPVAEKQLLHAMHHMLALDTSKMEPFQAQAALSLRDELLGRFEARDFGVTLMASWDEAKARYEAGDLPPAFT